MLNGENSETLNVSFQNPRKSDLERTLQDPSSTRVGSSDQSSFLKLSVFKTKAKKLKKLNTFRNVSQFKENSKGNESYAEIIKLRPITRYEILEQYSDKLPLLTCRLALLRIKHACTEICLLIIGHKIFEYFIILIILINTVTLAIFDNNSYSAVQRDLDFFFLVIYTIEMSLKITAHGLGVFHSGYMRDYWNILDFFIVVTGWISYEGSANVNINSLRTLRILRPLRGISSIAGLRVLFVALIGSVQQLLASLFLLLVFLIIFAIAGLQLWSGIMKSKCMNTETGEYSSDPCGALICPTNAECVKSLDNPQYGVTSFDNLLSAMLVVFQCVTLEGWTDVLFSVQKVFSRYTVVYFVLLAFIGAYMLVNLTLAVIKGAFTVAMNDVRAKEMNQKNADEIVHSKLIAEQLKEPEVRERIEYRTAAVSEVDLSNDEEVQNDDDARITQNFSARLRPRHFRSLLDGPRTGMTSEFLGIGGTLVRKMTQNYQRQLTHVYDNESSNNLTPHLISMNSSIGVNRSLLAKLGTTASLQTIKVQILASHRFGSESVFDIVPKKQGYDLLDTLSFQTEYKFRYKQSEEKLHGMDEIEDQVLSYFESLKSGDRRKVFKYFTELSLKFGAKKAFWKVKVCVKEFIKVIKERDNISKNIIAIHSEVDAEKPLKPRTLNSLSNLNYRLWKSGYLGHFDRFSTPIKWLVTSRLFTFFISLIVISNIVTLSLNRYGMSRSQEDTLTGMNTSFTIIFAVEMGLKLIGLGPKQYIRDRMNYLDLLITLLSIIELIFISKSGSAISAFRGVRVFRLIRVVRIVRLFRYLQSMAHIFSVISKSISKFIYLALFLLLLIVIYSLLGMRIFANILDSSITRSNFDSFHWAFITVFQVLTLENWQTVLYAVVNSSAGYASCLYLVSWIFIGNYVVLNLFLAILLDAFSENDEPVVNLESGDEEGPNNRRSSLYGNYNERLNKKRELNIQRIQEIPDQDSDFEIDHLNSMTRLEMIYDGIECEKSFGLFSKKNKLRVLCIKVSNSTKFEWIILVIITLSSIKLVVDTYLSPSDTSTFIDAGFTLAFALESMIHSISLGFCMSKGSYLRDWWNLTDFLIVVISIIDFSVSGISVKYIKVFRLLRTLRPLRFVSHNLSMKIIVKALLESIVAIINVVVVCMIIWLMFAILGVSLFGGKLYQCTNKSIDSMRECENSGFEWEVIYPNYDNIMSAMVTLFILSSLEGWPDLMYAGIDARDIGLAPQKNFNPYVAYYFIGFVFIGSLFFLNLFIGVIFDKFNEAKKNETDSSSLILNKDQVIWVEMQKLIINSKLKLENTIKKDSKVQIFLFKIAKSAGFTYFILTCIVLNMVQMAMIYDGASAEYSHVLDGFNLAFTLIFIFEALIKLAGIGVREYFKNHWNRFDFFVVTTSVIDLTISYFINYNLYLLRIGPQLIRVLRVLRVSRLVRLFNFLKPLQNLLTIMTYSLPAIMNVLSLLLLLFFIYAVLGVYLFSDTNDPGIIDNYSNFNNFGMAMITLFRCSTGENWYQIMQAFYKTHGVPLSCAYFMSFITISTFVMFNLFIMVILQNYDDYMSNPDSLIKNFTTNYKEIKLAWTNHCEDELIYFKELRPIMYDLGSSLGVPPDTNFEKLSRILASLNLEVTASGQVYFKDFMFCILRRKYGKKVKNTPQFKKLVLKEEQNTRKKIKQMRSRLESKNRQRVQRKSRVGIENSGGNYFMEMMSAKIAFKAWRGYAQKRRQKHMEMLCSLSITPRDDQEEFPGPGAYVGHQELRFQKSEIPFQTTSIRDSSKTNQIPGPGSYNSSKANLKADQFGKFRCSSSFASNQDRFTKPTTELNPGPGSYNQKSSWNNSKRSQSTKSSAKVMKSYPSVPSIPSQGQAFGYDETESGDLICQRNPLQVHSGLGVDSIGPGHYDPRPVSEIYGAKGTVWHKSSAKRQVTPKGPSNLGPGSYSEFRTSNLYKLKSSPAFASTCKRESYVPLDYEDSLEDEARSKDGNPGPGKYFISNGNVGKSQKEFQKFGSGSKRFQSDKNFVPGPGFYAKTTQQEVKMQKAPFASTDSRFTSKPNKIPGPGTYNEPNFIEAMGKKVKSQAPAAFGTGFKRFAEAGEKAGPGPGDYDTSQQIGIHNSAKQKPSAVFESAFDRNKAGLLNEGPAPGSYDIPSAFENKTGKRPGGFTRWEKHKIKYDEPETLDPAEKMNKRKDTEGKMIEKYVNLEGFDKNSTPAGYPGPGAYFKKSVKFGVDKEKNAVVSKVNRFQRKENHNPGPGKYEDSNNWWNKKTFNIKFTEFK